MKCVFVCGVFVVCVHICVRTQELIDHNTSLGQVTFSALLETGSLYVSQASWPMGLKVLL